MPSWEETLGGQSTASQFLLWGVGYALAQQLLAPALQGISNEVWGLAADGANPRTRVPLSPADLANAVVRNFTDQASAQGEAQLTGTAHEDFQLLVDLAGDAPGPQELAVALRRKLIDQTGTGAASTSFEQGIAEGRLKDKWADVIRQLAVEWPTPTDALQAYLEGQVDEATAHELYQRFGGDPEYFTLLYNTRGSAPSPVEAGRMANRGIIGWTGTGPEATSFEQAFLEGPWRNKWSGPMAKLAEYVPPPRTITTLISHGVIDQAKAEQYFRANGMSAELAAIYTQSAGAARTTKQRELTEATIGKLYQEKFATRAQAAAMLAELGYTAAEATELLDLEDFQREFAALNRAVTRVGTLLTSRKLDAGQATDALNRLGLPADQVAHLVATWGQERAASIRILTPAEITAAFHYGVKDQAWAMSSLEGLGYSAHDAWVLLSTREHAPLPGEPPDGPPVGAP